MVEERGFEPLSLTCELSVFPIKLPKKQTRTVISQFIAHASIFPLNYSPEFFTELLLRDLVRKASSLSTLDTVHVRNISYT